MSLRDLSTIADAYRDVGAWHDRTFHQVVDGHAAEDPGKLAIEDQERSFTYQELVTASRRLATWLAGLDLPSGTPVAFQTPSSALLPVVHLACNRADLTFVPLTDSFRERELRHLLSVSRAAVAFVPSRDDDRDRLGLVQSMREDLPDLRVLGGIDGPGDVSLVELLADGPAEEVSLLADADAPRHCMITSGTTELSRMSQWSDNNLWFFLSQYRDAVELVPEDLALGLAPANGGSTGYVFPVLTPLLFGASSVLQQQWDAHKALELFGQHRPTLATAIPTQIVQLLEQPEAFAAGAGSLRVFNNAGAPLAPEAAARTESLLDCRIHTCYGASDGGVPCMTRVSDPPPKRHTTVGRPLPHTDLRLVDEAMHDVGEDEPGELLWRNATKTFGYLNDPERTEATFFEDGWYRSGDLGVIDEDGYVRIVGRRKDMILRGGRNISPAEIEHLLIAAPDIAEVAVVGVPDEVYGERICACIVPAAGATVTMESVAAVLTEAQTERFKFPERIELFDALPQNIGGKVDKRALQDLVRDRAPAGVSD